MSRTKAVTETGEPSRTAHAKALFAPLGPTYDRYAALLSYGQDPRWRRFLVSQIDAGPGSRVLDVATGTGAVARELVRQHGCRVVGVDQSAEMLAEARRRTNGSVELVEASADSLPFADDDFDALTFTYLLRYVGDPAATLRELARVVRPGGTIAGLEFGVPAPLWRLPWELHVRVGLPAAGAVIGGGWREVGSFLGSSIRDFNARWPLPRLVEAWRAAGIDGVQTYRLSLGGGVVTWGRRELKPAYYALRPGGWRDYVTVLHLPYTLWNLSYVALGAAIAPHFSTSRMLWTMAAFALALGVAAHMLDELNGRPLRTQIGSGTLIILSALSLAGACAIGIWAAFTWDYGLLVFVAIGAFTVPAYNLEWFGGRLHNAWGLALSWAAFPVLTAYFAQAETLRADAILAAAYATGMILVQRTLSTPVRRARRQLGTVEGVEPMERALRILPWASVLLAAALVTGRLT